MKRVHLEYFAKVWNEFSGHKSQTSEVLDISLRSAYSYKRECRKEGIELFEPCQRSRAICEGEICLLPEQRRKYKDEMLNRNWL